MVFQNSRETAAIFVETRYSFVMREDPGNEVPRSLAENTEEEVSNHVLGHVFGSLAFPCVLEEKCEASVLNNFHVSLKL